MLRIRSIGVTLLVFGLAAAPAPSSRAETQRSLLSNGLSVWVSEGGSDAATTVRLEILTGLRDERGAAIGQSAAIGAWLLRAPVEAPGAESLEVQAQAAGIALDVDLERGSVVLALTCPHSALERAIWLASTRLMPAQDRGLQGALRSGLDTLLHRAEPRVLGPLGDALDMATFHIRGRDGGSTAFASYLDASRGSDASLDLLARGPMAEVPVRVVVVAGPGGGAKALSHVRRAFSALPQRPSPPARPADEPEATRTRRTAGVATTNQGRDASKRVVVGWDLRGAGSQAAVALPVRDAALLLLGEWLSHPGGRVKQELVHQRALALEVRNRVHFDWPPLVLVEATVRGTDVRDARAFVVETMEGLGAVHMPSEWISGAGQVAAVALEARFAFAPARAFILSGLIDRGIMDPEGHVAEVLGHLRAVDTDAVRRVWSQGLVADRRQVLEIDPAEAKARDDIRVDADTLSRYLELVVDLRCPSRTSKVLLGRLLSEKYDMTLREYVRLTRAVARRPRVMQDVSEEARSRCREYDKLRRLLDSAKVVRLHEAVACGPGTHPTKGAERRSLRRIYKRFRIDPSWYRPLVNMTRTELGHRDALAAIDSRCPESPLGEKSP